MMDKQQTVEFNAASVMRDIVEELRQLRDWLDAEELWIGEDDETAPEGYCDVRIQLFVDDDLEVTWSMKWGDCQYDPDHRGFWGSGTLSSEDNDGDIEELVEEFIDQALDAWSDGEIWA